MSNDSLKMVTQQTFKPEQILILSGMAHVHDLDDVISHEAFILSEIRQSQLLLDQIQGKKKLVLFKQLVIAFFIAGFTNYVFGFKQTTPLVDETSFTGVLVLLLQSGSAGSKVIAGSLQPFVSLFVAFIDQASLLVPADFI